MHRAKALSAGIIIRHGDHLPGAVDLTGKVEDVGIDVQYVGVLGGQFAAEDAVFVRRRHCIEAQPNGVELRRVDAKAALIERRCKQVIACNRDLCPQAKRIDKERIDAERVNAQRINADAVDDQRVGQQRIDIDRVDLDLNELVGDRVKGSARTQADEFRRQDINRHDRDRLLLAGEQEQTEQYGNQSFHLSFDI